MNAQAKTKRTRRDNTVALVTSNPSMTLVGGSNHGSLLMRTRNRRGFTDLNGRSGETEVHKAMVVNGTPSSAVAVTIVVDDDDDDVVVSSPRSFNQVQIFISRMRIC